MDLPVAVIDNGWLWLGFWAFVAGLVLALLYLEHIDNDKGDKK